MTGGSPKHGSIVSCNNDQPTMKPERLQKIDQVFQSALDLAPQRRPRFLDEACAADPDLRREVESLLDAHEQAGDFIEDSALRDQPVDNERWKNAGQTRTQRWRGDQC